MDIVVTNDVPVAKTYNAIPRPLYEEVKNHLQDFQNKGFICKSTSSYVSVVVCVRKRGSSLRLCIDYRWLNKKTHPILHIQEILNGLGGNAWFSVLDQGKAYHQGKGKGNTFTQHVEDVRSVLKHQQAWGVKLRQMRVVQKRGVLSREGYLS